MQGKPCTTLHARRKSSRRECWDCPRYSPFSRGARRAGADQGGFEVLHLSAFPPRGACVSALTFSLSLSSLRLLRLCVLLLRDPLVQAGVGCRRRARSRSRRWLSTTSARWSALWPGAASAGGVAGVLAGGSAGIGGGGRGGRWGPASARGGPGVSSIPESSRCVRVADGAGGAQARSLPNSNNTRLLTAD